MYATYYIKISRLLVKGNIAQIMSIYLLDETNPEQINRASFLTFCMRLI